MKSLRLILEKQNKMRIRDFTREEIPRAIAMWLEAEVNNDIKDWHTVIMALREGTWLRFFERGK